MLGPRLYYSLKPFLPRSFRMAIRRVVARRTRRVSTNIWPIDESAGRPPAGWAGWPDGKKFAIVLTHDIEGADGLANCQQLAELEIDLGFKSSYNFVPEGTYDVPPSLRAWLAERGFEVGVHDLEHDGRLFQSERGFKKKAERINQYLRYWGAAGFRAGFMLRHQDWLHRLDVQYDATTFDTDPFEFQPIGANTIFPSWVHAPTGGGAEDKNTAQARGGYVELPYTLPQDSTLFLILGETSPEIWIKKLDWIVRHGGMALVNVHPDYISFPGMRKSGTRYPSKYYADLLHYISGKYRGEYWNPLPRDLAAWFRAPRQDSEKTPAIAKSDYSGNRHAAELIEATLRGKRTAVILYSTYPSDPRPRRAAEAMIDAGMEVDLLCLSESATESSFETVSGVKVHRLPMQRRRASKRAYFWLYGRFLLSSFWFLSRNQFRRRYDLVHVHNMPDVLVFAALIPKLFGAKIVLDLHDPMPELMMTIYGAPKESAQIRLLRYLERWSIAFADAVLTVNEACKRLFSARSCPSDKVTVIMNSPDERIFTFREPAEDPSPTPSTVPPPFRIMYHGSLVERHGLDIAVTALRMIRTGVPNAELSVYGHSTQYLQDVLKTVEGTDLQDAVHYYGPKQLEQIVDAIRQCSIGVIPNRRSVFTEINTPTRIFEYLSQGKPVIAPRVPGILDYFGPNDLLYFELGNADDLASKLEFAYRNPREVLATVRRGQEVYQSHCWSSERQKFAAFTAGTLNSSSRAPKHNSPPTELADRRVT
jgi:glycosyltransferase involved in cell wall biosynthesis